MSPRWFLLWEQFFCRDLGEGDATGRAVGGERSHFPQRVNKGLGASGLGFIHFWVTWRTRGKGGNHSSIQVSLDASRPESENPKASELATIQSSPGLFYFLQCACNQSLVARRPAVGTRGGLHETEAVRQEDPGVLSVSVCHCVC